MDEEELKDAILHSANPAYSKLVIRGLMGMASFTEDKTIVRKEFRKLRSLFDQYKQSGSYTGFTILSMGMSGDYDIALEEGSTMIRIGSLIFGERNYVAK
jgi:uncharacterized pyridoxal phosphate-containing UPF0001 family protein